MNFHYMTEGPSADAFRAGFGKAVEIAVESGAQQMGLAVSQLKILQGQAHAVLGGVADALMQGDHRAAVDIDGAEIELCVITQLINPLPFAGPVLAAYVSLDQIETLAAKNGVTDIVLVPHSATEATQFAANYDSEELPLPG